MSNQSEQNRLVEKLRGLHSDDEKQLEVIFSESNRIIVEAPAGYGKTRTMISKVAYLLATEKISYPKKILALTFSVNAAYKIKKDLAENLPSLVQSNGSNQLRINERLFVSNYHGFCRHILRKYGYLLHQNLSNLDFLKALDDSNTEKITDIFEISVEEALIFSRFSGAIKNVDRDYLSSHFSQYTDGIIKTFLDKECISFNGIIALTLRLFIEHGEILEFYQSYFPIIIVDEFQDTNALSWALLRKLVTAQSKLFFMGDSLQRIYGFIGAMPGLLHEAEQRFSMKRIVLDKNYRFASNPQMLQLDRNIRLNAENSSNPSIQTDAEVSLTLANTQLEESQGIVRRLRYLFTVEADKSCKFAILVKQRGTNINKIIKVLSKNKIPYFYALFVDDDPDYLLFHRECSSQFTDQLREGIKISKGSLGKLCLRVEKTFRDSGKPVIASLLNLLRVFLDRVSTDYSFLSAEDKVVLIRDTFDNKTLKQNMEYIDRSVIISTIHGAKGLEWDYVLMPDMEQYSIPNWRGLCGSCNYKNSCNLTVSDKNRKPFLEELSVFYVGVTRARKQIFFSASKTRLNSSGIPKNANLSCMLRLPGIVHVKA